MSWFWAISHLLTIFLIYFLESNFVGALGNGKCETFFTTIHLSVWFTGLVILVNKCFMSLQPLEFRLSQISWAKKNVFAHARLLYHNFRYIIPYFKLCNFSSFSCVAHYKYLGSTHFLRSGYFHAFWKRSLINLDWKISFSICARIFLSSIWIRQYQVMYIPLFLARLDF